MAKHYGRDGRTPDNGNYGMNMTASGQFVYHMLRVAGCENLWECDGDVGPNFPNPSHVTDGNTQNAGVGDWTEVEVPMTGGVTLAKDTVNYMSGIQSLSVTTTDAGDGVRTSALVTITPPTNQGPFASANYLTGPVNNIMTFHRASSAARPSWVGNLVTFSGCLVPGNNGTFEVTKCVSSGAYEFYNPAGGPEDVSGYSPNPERFTSIKYRYEICIWAKAPLGETWDVQVDRGDGSYFSVGSIVGTGDWEMTHFTFYTQGAGNCFVQVLDTVTGGHTINIQAINVFRSLYEYRSRNVYNDDTPGGAITAPDLFDTSLDGLTPTTDDVGKWLFTWDPTNPTNSGYYKILAVSGGKYQLDLKSGTMTLVNATGLRWRIVPIDDQFWDNNPFVPMPTYVKGAGFGLESPHSTHWRFFSRHAYEYPYWPCIVWASPEDCDFDHSTGFFYLDEPSTHRHRCSTYVEGGANQQWWGGNGNTSTGSPDRTTREFFMTDDDVSFFTHIKWDNSHSIGAGDHGMIIAGYMGADSDHPGIEEFALLTKFGTTSAGNEMTFNGGGVQNGTTFNKEKVAVKVSCSVLGYGSATAAVMTQSNSCPNPWSTEEHLDPLILVRDPDDNQGCPSEREADIGIYMGRTNQTPLATFDGGAFVHFENGLVWEWNGATLV